MNVRSSNFKGTRYHFQKHLKSLTIDLDTFDADDMINYLLSFSFFFSVENIWSLLVFFEGLDFS